jgi:hypothetical protein
MSNTLIAFDGGLSVHLQLSPTAKECHGSSLQNTIKIDLSDNSFVDASLTRMHEAELLVDVESTDNAC